MKKIIALLLISAYCYCQGLNVDPSASQSNGISFIQKDWELAKALAKKEDKTIFLDMYTTWCKPCKQMDKFVFTKEEVGQRFNDSFINVKIDAESEVGKKLASDFGVLSYPTYIFASNEGDIIYKIKGAMTPKQLILEATKARSIARRFKPLRELQGEYEAGNRDHKFLYEYLRQKTNKEGRQSKILEEYVSVVPESELQTEKVLNTISKNIKSIHSESFNVLKNALSKFDSFTDRQRQAIIRGITIAKKLTFKQVIESNNMELFEQLIEAVHATAYSTSGAMAEEKQFRFDLAKLTRDFTAYSRLAVEQARFLMNRSAEELKYETEQSIENFKYEATNRDLSENSPQYQYMLKNLKNHAEKSVSYQLNELAWGYVLMAELPGDLERALRWSERSLELLVTPVHIDTKANLLYRLDRRRDAIKLEKRAIKLGKKMRINTSNLEESLKLMRKRLPVNFFIKNLKTK